MLIKSDTPEAISKNINTELKSGKPLKQSIAIALSIAKNIKKSKRNKK